MTRATKAALLSGLVFPGVGHLSLKAYWRGAGLIAATAVAFAVLVDVALKRALVIADRIASGDVPLDPAAITALLSRSAAGANDSLASGCTWVVGLCWIIAVVDSYRLGLRAP